MDKIELAIENAKVFVPIFSNNIQKEAMVAHVYRKEWRKALDLQNSMGSRTFIIPIHQQEFNFYTADIPKELKDYNSIAFNENLDFAPVLNAINEALNKLDNFKSHSA